MNRKAEDAAMGLVAFLSLWIIAEVFVAMGGLG